MDNTTRILKCPQCSKPVTWTSSNKSRPFCSKRCKLLDLGDWANESHRIGGETLAPHDQSDLHEFNRNDDFLN